MKSRDTLPLMLLWWPPLAFAEHITDTEGSEPASSILLILGLLAILMGMRNLRDLRTKRFNRPRTAGPAHKGAHETLRHDEKN